MFNEEFTAASKGAASGGTHLGGEEDVSFDVAAAVIWPYKK